MRPEYVLKLLEKSERIDGRKLEELRKIRVETGVIKRAEGSASVEFGKTRVIVGVKMDVVQPFPDVPEMGVLKTEAEFTPLASPEFEPGPPGEDATELARVVDRGIRESECIDLEKLCLEKGEKVWGVFVDIYIINHDGNLIDASALGAVAALKTTMIPKLEDEEIIREELVEKLPILHTPVTVTVGKVLDKYLVDPIKDEEEVLDSKLTIAVTEEGKICAMQKGGDHGLSEEDVTRMIELALKKSEEIRKLL